MNFSLLHWCISCSPLIHEVDNVENTKVIRKILQQEKKDINDDCSCCNDLQYIQNLYVSFTFRYPEKIRKECIFWENKKKYKKARMKEISQTVILLVWRLSITVWNCFVFRNILLHFYIEKSSLKCPRIKDNIEEKKKLKQKRSGGKNEISCERICNHQKHF